MIPSIVAVGGSLGGPRAFGDFVRGLPSEDARETPPVVLVLHRAAESTEGLASWLTRLAGRPVREVVDDSALTAGIHLAPANYHLLVDGERLRLSVDPPVCFARPSIDVFFQSVSESYHQRASAVLLTAASRDGAAGIEAVARRGGQVFVQEPSTAESPVAPEAAIARLAQLGLKPVTGSPEELGVALGRHFAEKR